MVLVATASSTISGNYNGTTKDSLAVQPSTLSNVTLSASPVVGGNNVTGPVTLNGKASRPNRGFAVQLGHDLRDGPRDDDGHDEATATTFTFATLGVAPNASSTITATFQACPKLP